MFGGEGVGLVVLISVEIFMLSIELLYVTIE